MADERFKRDENRETVAGGVTDDSDLFIKALRVDPTTFRLKVTSTSTLSNIEYDEGDTDASLTGLVSMAEGPSNTVTPLQVDASKHLQVDIAADSVGIGGGTQYAEDSVHSSGDTGTMALVVRNDAGTALAADGDYIPLMVNSAGALYVTGGGGGVEYTEGNTDATITGTAILWEDAGDTLVTVNASKPLPINVTNASLAVTGTFWQATQPVSGTFWQATQPVSIAQDVMLGTDFSNVFGAASLISATPAVKVEEQGTVAVSGTFWQATQPVSLASVPSHAVTNAGTFVVQEDGAALTALQLIDDVVFVDDTAVHATGTTKGAGIMAAATPTDGSVDANDIGMLAMSTDRRLHVDAQIVGTDAALDVSGATVTVDLGANNDVTIATLPDTGAGDLAAMVVDLAAIEALAITIDADTSNMATSLGNLDNAVDGNFLNVNANIAGTDSVGGAGAVAAGVQRVTLASDDPAVAKLGTIDTDTGNMVTALQLIDNAVDGNYLNVNLNIAGTDVTGGAGAVAATTQRVTLASDDPAVAKLGTIDTDTGNIATSIQSIDGAIIGPGEPTIDSYTHAAINLAAAANQVLVASAANKQIWVYGLSFTLSVAGTVSFQDEDDTAITGIMDFAANSGLGIPPSGNFSMPIWKLATDKDLEVDIVTADVDGWIDYAIVSV